MKIAYSKSKGLIHAISLLLSFSALIPVGCGSDGNQSGGVHSDPKDPYPEPNPNPDKKADPLYRQQAWYFDAVHLPEAWKYGRGDRNLVVAVIDTGKVNHSDLNEKWVDGYDFAFGRADAAADDQGTSFHHGAHVAGIIAAKSENGIGIAGVCPECMLMPLRYAKAEPLLRSDESGTPHFPTECLDASILASNKCNAWDTDCIARERERCIWKATTEVLARSILYAAGLEIDDGTGKRVKASRPADVINISSGNKHFPERNGYAPLEVCTGSLALDGAIKAARQANVPVVVAAGNMDDRSLVPSENRHGEMVMDRDNNNYLWAGCPVLSVAAVSANGTPETYTTLGQYISISAPGGSAQVVADPEKERSDGVGVFIDCPKEYVEHELGVTGMHGIVSTWMTGALGIKDTPSYKNGKPCYRHLSGTSMAAPIVAGVVALMRAQDRKLTVGQIEQILDLTATQAPCSNKGKKSCGAGMVDANAAVSAARPPDAALSCMVTGLGRFSCQYVQPWGLAPALPTWSVVRNAVLDSGQERSSMVSGSCGTDSAKTVVSLKLSDRFGRTASVESSFYCMPGEHP